MRFGKTAWGSASQTALASVLALALAGCATGYDSATESVISTIAPEVQGVELTTPPQRDPSELSVLFWNDAQRSARFRDMENWFAGHEVPAAGKTRELPQGTPLSPALQETIREYMAQNNSAGVMVLQDGKVRFEDYRLGLGAQDRWTSFSVAKSFTSTLLGAAIADGFIGSLDEPVTLYVPELAGSAYDGVNIRQVATMTSGAAWNEDYTDPKSDVAMMASFTGPDAIVKQMGALKREAEPGEKWVYKTGETNLLGLIVENAVGLSLAEYAQTRIVEPAGFSGGLFWMVDPRGGSIAGCCLSLRLSDYARMGQFVLDDGVGIGGDRVVPEGWFAEATAPQVEFGDGGFGYGYQWWTYPSDRFGAQGIFGQSIMIVPQFDLVIAMVSNWPQATGGDLSSARGAVAARIISEASDEMPR